LETETEGGQAETAGPFSASHSDHGRYAIASRPVQILNLFISIVHSEIIACSVIQLYSPSINFNFHKTSYCVGDKRNLITICNQLNKTQWRDPLALRMHVSHLRCYIRQKTQLVWLEIELKMKIEYIIKIKTYPRMLLLSLISPHGDINIK
jgi:hypothetical protein